MKLIKRLIAAVLALVLVGLAPGLESYRIVAQVFVESPVVSQTGGVAGPGFVTPGVAAGGAGVTPGASANLGHTIGGNAAFNGRRFAPVPVPVEGQEQVEDFQTAETEVRTVPAAVETKKNTVVSDLGKERTRIVAEQKSAPAQVTPETAMTGGTREFERVVFKRRVANGVAPQFGMPDAGTASPRGPPKSAWPALSGKGSIDLSDGRFAPHEMSIAKFLKAEGRVVKALPEDGSDHHRHPDALVDGVAVEFKTRLPELDASERRTHKTNAGWVVKTVEHSLGIHRKEYESTEAQARVMILDARGTALQPQHVLQAVASLAPYFGPRLDSLRVIGEGFDVAYGAWPVRTAPGGRTRNGIAQPPSSGDRSDSKTASGLAPPAAAGAPLPKLAPYKAPVAATLWIQTVRVLHYGSFAASVAALVTWLGVSGGAVPLVIIAGFVWFANRKEAKEAAAADPNPNVQGLSYVSPENLSNPMLARWYRSYLIVGNLMRRLGKDPRGGMPGVKLEGKEEGLDPETAGSTGNGFGHTSSVGIGDVLAESPTAAIAGVVAHEIGHLHFKDSRLTRELRAPERGGSLIRGFFRHGVLWGVAAASVSGAVSIASISPLGLAWGLCLLMIAPAVAAFKLTVAEAQRYGEGKDAPPGRLILGLPVSRDFPLLAAWGGAAAAGKAGALLLGLELFVPFSSLTLLAASLVLAGAGWVAGNALTRAKEFRADHFSAWLAHPKWIADYLEQVILRKEKANGRDRMSALELKLTSDYPSTQERIRRLRAMEAKAGPAPDAESLTALWDDPFVGGLPVADGLRGNPGGSRNGMAERFSLLYAREKSGHAQAAKAIADQLEKTEPAVTLSHTRWDTAVSPAVSAAGTGLYGWILRRAPFLWELVYDNPVFDAVTKAPVDLFLTASGRRVAEAMKASRPQAAIATQALLCASLAAAMAKDGITVPLFGVLTDFTLNSYWIRPEVTHYFVAADEVRDEMVRRGVPADKITVSGIPIHPKFGLPMTKAQARADLGLDADTPVLLLSGGSHGLGGFGETVRELQALKMPVQIVIVTGGNKELRAELEAEFGADPRIRVEGYVTNMDVWMRAADLMLGKPGGLTTAESLTVGLPLAIMDPLPGQESRNTKHLLERGAAIELQRGGLTAELSALLSDKPALARLQANALKLARPDAARTIVDKIQSLLP